MEKDSTSAPLQITKIFRDVAILGSVALILQLGLYAVGIEEEKPTLARWFMKEKSIENCQKKPDCLVPK